MKLLTRAVIFAAEKHGDQFRKGTKTPYIVHPMEAVSIAATLTDDEAVLAAAALHDTAEDCGVTIEELRELFGDEVAELVAADTEDKREHLSACDTWKARKQETLDALANMDRRGKIIVLSDKLSNIRSIYRDHTVMGDRLWERFNCKDKSEQCWYYTGIASALEDGFSGEVAFKEYTALLGRVFGMSE